MFLSTDDTQVNIQNQDVELNSLRNDYAEIGPHANNGNKGSSLLNHNGYDDSQIQVVIITVYRVMYNAHGPLITCL